MENDDTLKSIIDELQKQHDQDVKRLSQVPLTVFQSIFNTTYEFRRKTLHLG